MNIYDETKSLWWLEVAEYFSFKKKKKKKKPEI
mgnify:CR=1 FL=1